MKSMHKFSFSQLPHKQRGIVLLVAMIMLVIMSILGISGIRGIALEERMSSNAYDNSLAFQAAEAALRAGEEAAIALAPGVEPADIPCNPATLLASASGGYISRTSMHCSPDWMSTTALQASLIAASTPLASDMGDLAGDAARFLIEYIGGDAPCYPGLNPDNKYDSCNAAEQDCTCHRYRVTAISNPGQGRATVLLQSVFFTR